jgi:hypothetical protein
LLSCTRLCEYKQVANFQQESALIAPDSDPLPRLARFLRTDPFASVRGVSVRCAAALAVATLVCASGCGSKQSSAGGGANDGASPGGPSSGPVTVPAGSPVTLSGRAADGTVSGRYRAALTQQSFSFSVRATGDTSAAASYTLETQSGDSLEVQVSLSGRSRATITMPGLDASITGIGPMPADQASQTLLDRLGSAFGPAIRAIPLELNCGSGFTPAEMAALLVPWQVVYKYQLGPLTRYGDVRAAADAATCATFEFAGASPTRPPQPITKAAGAGLVNIGNDDSLPTVFGFFPLDGAGSKEDDPSAAVSAISTSYGTCNSMCRGACGADCESNNCKSATGLWRCEVDAFGANTGYKLVYTDYVCGTHPACIAHDDCYDGCNAMFGCGSLYANVCMHAVGHTEAGYASCDQRVADGYGLSQGLDWARGYGPYTAEQTYRYVTSREWDTTTCPLNREIWTGTSKVVFSASGDPATSLLTMTASFILEIDDGASTANAKVFRPNSGTVTWSSFEFDGVCTTTGGPQIEALRPEDGVLHFFVNDTGGTIDAEGVMYRPPPAATFHTHCNDWRGDFDTTGAMGGTWLSVPEGTVFADGASTVTGRIDIPPFLSEWSFTR